MTPPPTTRLPHFDSESLSALAKLVMAIPPGRRVAILPRVVAFRPAFNLDDEFARLPLRHFRRAIAHRRRAHGGGDEDELHGDCGQYISPAAVTEPVAVESR